MKQKRNALTQALKAKGYRMTAARQAILDVFVNCGGHISADGLVEEVRQETPNIGRMTVYRTLDLLCQLGLIRPVYQGTGAAHYVMMIDGHHHHLICSNCGDVLEVDECILEEVDLIVSNRFDFKIQGHLFEFFGLCCKCQN